MHYYQFNIADYRKDTVHLTRIEHSIYRDLIDWYYLEETLEDALDFAEEACGTRYSVDLKTIARGGIIGSVEIVDCVSKSDSPWFVGDFGFVLRDPQPLPFVPWKGQLGFFDVPESALTSNAEISARRCDGLPS